MRRYHHDNPKALTKSRELEVYSTLHQRGLAFDYLVGVPFADCSLGSETRCAFLDFLLPKPLSYPHMTLPTIILDISQVSIELR